MSNNPLRAGLIPLHIMYHAAKGEVYGQGMIDELRRHGYKIGPGTLYPMLHRLEERGFLRGREERHGRIMRRFYRATTKGRAALKSVKPQVVELFEELIKGHEPVRRRRASLR
ncbi:MAG: PadR family transcriptional regulator [Steroidobacteraceae bacterium]|nr:PadR family transcriptional regulator [Steroidobacteraceae bacterium]